MLSVKVKICSNMLLLPQSSVAVCTIGADCKTHPPSASASTQVKVTSPQLSVARLGVSCQTLACDHDLRITRNHWCCGVFNRDGLNCTLLLPQSSVVVNVRVMVYADNHPQSFQITSLRHHCRRGRVVHGHVVRHSRCSPAGTGEFRCSRVLTVMVVWQTSFVASVRMVNARVMV